LDVLRAWGTILRGRRPSLSIEITRECPLHCPGCYAYEPSHLGGGVTLKELADRKGDALVRGVLDVVDRLKPLHLSLVGGDPLVRYRELETLVPLLIDRGVHIQIVTSAFRPIPRAWIQGTRLSVVVSIDGLPSDHDARRAPATYERILENIEGHKVIVHCTVTGQMMKRPGYLEEFLRVWTPKEEVDKIWFSLFTPQLGSRLPEILTSGERQRAVRDMLHLRRRYSKLQMPERLIRQFAEPPGSPEKCVFAQTTTSLSADLTTEVTPCQLGGNPDCQACGCYAAMGLAAVGNHRWGGIVPLSALFAASRKIGVALSASPRPKPEVNPLRIQQ
jgi:MoaA/NifB/PqqE/SkfB family radical SAM enzyme